LSRFDSRGLTPNRSALPLKAANWAPGPLGSDPEAGPAVERPMRRRDSLIAAIVVAVSVVTMAIDHLFGTESEPGESWPVDPSAFVLSMAIALALTAVLFRFVVRPARAENATRRAIVCSVLAVLTVPLLFLAVPFPFAGAGIALGLAGRTRAATAAAAVGALVLAVGLVAYVVAAVS
jgi:hypothetical protein